MSIIGETLTSATEGARLEHSRLCLTQNSSDPRVVYGSSKRQESMTKARHTPRANNQINEVMKRFYVNVRYEVLIPIEVVAKDEDEAMDLAYDEVAGYSLNEGIISDPSFAINNVENI